MRDVDYALHKGRYNLKALTPKAMEVMGADMGGPWQMASEIFYMKVSEDSLASTLAQLRSKGLQTEPDPPEVVDVSKFTDF
jgi:hypothetical protein